MEHERTCQVPSSLLAHHGPIIRTQIIGSLDHQALSRQELA